MQHQAHSTIANGPDRRVGSSRAKILRSPVCCNRDLCVPMEARDGLTATSAERADFQGLWPSNGSVAGSLGYRGANEGSWNQLVAAVGRILKLDRTACAHRRR